MNAPETSLSSEPLLAGRYAHVEELGRGASGRVLLVEDRTLGGFRAAKIVSRQDAERLRWELTLLASLSHPGLAQVFELVSSSAPLGAPFRLEAGAWALIEEYVEGASAAERVAAFTRDDERARFVVRVGMAVARALSAIHAAGLVHGDVKPDNVVVPEEPSEAKLIDLGLARVVGMSPTLSGTPGFLAPEAWLGERSVATDLYALGATLHALVSGRSAFDTAGSSLSLAEALRARPSAAELPSGVPRGLGRLIGDLLADAPSARPASAREVALRLAALGAEVGAPMPETAAFSEAPTGLERAMRATLRPLVGRRAELAALAARMREPGVVVVTGPPGAGRSRLVREAARAVQAEAARRDERVPTYVATPGERVPHLRGDAIVHLESGALDGLTLAAAVEAAAVEGRRLTVVVERPAARDRASDERAAAIAVGPLDGPSLRRLVAELIEVDPAEPLLEAARAASGGLPGRLCRLVAEALEAGLDPTRPATMEALGRRAWGTASIPEAARELAELLAAAGGALLAVPAARLCADAAQQARMLRSMGLAHESGGRIALRADVRAAIELEPARRRALAEALCTTSLDPLADGHVRAALGDGAGAADAFLDAMSEARREGEPERAAAIGADARAALAGCDPRDRRAERAIALASADALRALAREDEALALLEDAGDEAAAMRAELARLRGDDERARREAERAPGLEARAVLARLALGAGDLDAALALSQAPEGETVSARLLEVRAFAELSRGNLDEAHAAARGALAQAEQSGSLALRARAVGTEGVVLASRGQVEEAAARYERAFELADRAGERHAAASFLVNVGLGHLERGEPGPAIDAFREGARRLTELGRRADATRALYNLGSAASMVGDDDLARDAIRRAAAGAASVGDRAAAALAAVVDAELALRAGKLEQAERALEPAWDGAPAPVRAAVGARLAIVRAVQGEIAEARALLAEADARNEDPEVALAATRVALAAGDDAEAVRSAERAREVAATWECRLRAELIGAEAFERAGRPAEAQAALARARALLDRAAASLPTAARARLRSVPAYQRALGATPAAEPAPADARWRALAGHAKRLMRETRIGRLHEAITDAAVELVSAERGFLVARAPDGATRLLAARAFGGPLEGERPSESVAARVLDGGRPLVTVDAIEDPRLGAAKSVHAMALRSVVALPLPLRGRRSMALVLDDRLRPAAFDDQALAVLRDLAELSAAALEAAEALRRERRDGRRLAREKERLSIRVESQARELGELRRRSDAGPFASIVAESEPMRRALHLAARVASADAPVLLRGESGTGKELVARAVHDASPRREGPYVSENVSAIPDTLLESALFGHVRGAFTGAERARRGLFEIADGGTLFLDEIGEMSEPMQAKLLRVLQDGELRPVGSDEARRVDVRVVSATHRNLEGLIEAGRFREDLFYRIAVVQVELPALRQRPDDVAPLVLTLLKRHAGEREVRVDRAAMAALRRYAWPGNVRQLENELRRALVLADDTIRLEHLSPVLRGDEADEAGLVVDELDLKGQTASLERRLIRAALERTGGNQTRAAELLGLSRYGLSKMMKRLAVR